jgi:predicted nuclease of predicted toxin-antitoxin system
MDILVDENIPLMSVAQLRGIGRNVLDVRNTPYEGMSDETLWEKSCTEKRLLITTDRGFARYRDQEHYGILIVSLRKPNRFKINDHVIEALRRFSADRRPGLLVVMRDRTMSTWRSGGSR